MLSAATLKRKQFRTIFFIELWERYAFYGFQALFILFITHEKLPQAKAYMIFGIFSALLWMLPATGGWLADRFFGIKRSLMLGGIIFSLGYLVLTFSESFEVIIIALALIAIGNGFFKSMPAALLSKIYNDNPTESKAAFTLYYMSINIGGLAASAVAPLVALHTSYNIAFFLSAIGMLFGLANFFSRIKWFKDVHNIADAKPFSFRLFVEMLLSTVILLAVSIALLHFLNISFYLTLILGLMVFIYMLALAKTSQTATERFKQYIGILLLIESIAFWILYNQVFSTFILFAKSNVTLSIFSFKLSPGNVVLLDPISIVILGPCIVKLYKTLTKHHIKVTIATKFAIGQVLAGLSVLVLAVVSILFAKQGYVNLGWLIVVFFIYGAGEILVSALGLSMTALYFPQRIISFALGAWFLTSAIGGVLTGKFAQLFATIPKTATAPESLHIYIQYFSWLGWLSIAIGIIYLIIARIVNAMANKRSIIID